eukprot:g19471.t1
MSDQDHEFQSVATTSTTSPSVESGSSDHVEDVQEPSRADEILGLIVKCRPQFRILARLEVEVEAQGGGGHGHQGRGQARRSLEVSEQSRFAWLDSWFRAIVLELAEALGCQNGSGGADHEDRRGHHRRLEELQNLRKGLSEKGLRSNVVSRDLLKRRMEEKGFGSLTLLEDDQVSSGGGGIEDVVRKIKARLREDLTQKSKLRSRAGLMDVLIPQLEDISAELKQLREDIEERLRRGGMHMQMNCHDQLQHHTTAHNCHLAAGPSIVELDEAEHELDSAAFQLNLGVSSLVAEGTLRRLKGRLDGVQEDLERRSCWACYIEAALDCKPELGEDFFFNDEQVRRTEQDLESIEQSISMFGGRDQSSLFGGFGGLGGGFGLINDPKSQLVEIHETLRLPGLWSVPPPYHAAAPGLAYGSSGSPSGLVHDAPGVVLVGLRDEAGEAENEVRSDSELDLDKQRWALEKKAQQDALELEKRQWELEKQQAELERRQAELADGKMSQEKDDAVEIVGEEEVDVGLVVTTAEEGGRAEDGGGEDVGRRPAKLKTGGAHRGTANRTVKGPATGCRQCREWEAVHAKDMPADASRIAQLEFESRLEKHQSAVLLMQKDKALFHLNSRDQRIAELEDRAKSKDEDLHQLKEVNEAYWDRIGDLENQRLALEDKIEDKDKQIAELQQRVRPQIPPVVVFRHR